MTRRSEAAYDSIHVPVKAGHSVVGWAALLALRCPGTGGLTDPHIVRIVSSDISVRAAALSTSPSEDRLDVAVVVCSNRENLLPILRSLVLN